MKTQPAQWAVKFAAVIFLATTLQTLVAETITWSINITPPGSCKIQWQTTSPVQNGTLSKSGKITFNKNADVNFKFFPQPGFKLIHVYKNLEDQIGWIASNGYQDSYGPVQKNHIFLVISELLSPTGTFSGNYADGLGLTPIIDVTGNYQGQVPNSSTNRTYNVDVAMDDSGKLQAMGTVTGLTDSEGNSTLSGSIGSIKTIDGKPEARLHGNLQGKLDGKPLTAAGRLSGPVEIQTVNGTKQVTGTVSGRRNYDGEKKSLPPTEIAIEVPNQHVNKIKKSWGLRLSFQKVTDPKTNKSHIEASALLRLTNGEYSKFPAKKVRYSPKTGYTVGFARGTKLNAAQQPVLDAKGNPMIDKKSRVRLLRLQFTGTEGNWNPASGNMTYRFLGQKGEGPIANFLD